MPQKCWYLINFKLSFNIITVTWWIAHVVNQSEEQEASEKIYDPHLIVKVVFKRHEGLEIFFNPFNAFHTWFTSASFHSFILISSPLIVCEWMDVNILMLSHIGKSHKHKSGCFTLKVEKNYSNELFLVHLNHDFN